MNGLAVVAVVSIGVMLTGCAGRSGPVRQAVLGGPEVEQETTVRPRPEVAEPGVVYVANFGLDAQSHEARSGSLERPRLLTLPHQNREPAQQAAKIVELTAQSLTDDLYRAGVPAQRLAPGVPLPPSGWLVRGVFTEADEGNMLRRAVVGFGTGSPKMDVQVGVSDLASQQPDAPFVIFGTVTDPERLPGGMVSRNPYVIAAKFVLEKGAPERDVKAVAQTIADKIVELREKVRAQGRAAGR